MAQLPRVLCLFCEQRILLLSNISVPILFIINIIKYIFITEIIISLLLLNYKK